MPSAGVIHHDELSQAGRASSGVTPLPPLPFSTPFVHRVCVSQAQRAFISVRMEPAQHRLSSLCGALRHRRVFYGVSRPGMVPLREIPRHKRRLRRQGRAEQAPTGGQDSALNMTAWAVHVPLGSSQPRMMWIRRGPCCKERNVLFLCSSWPVITMMIMIFLQRTAALTVSDLLASGD